MTQAAAPPTIAPAPAESVVRRLLASANLPAADITPEKLETFFALERDGDVLGIVGLELYGRVGLLRSLVVSPGRRSQGAGSALVAHAERAAAGRGVAELYLLTTTAEAFFRRRGYETTARAEAPDAIRRTAEFAGLCPSTSAFMVKHLVDSRETP